MHFKAAVSDSGCQIFKLYSSSSEPVHVFGVFLLALLHRCQFVHRHPECVFVCCIRVDEADSLLAPFNYKIQPSWNSPKYLVSVISTEVTYVVGGLIFAWIVEEWVWDYAITITLLHVGLTVAVMADFPSTQHWWIALGSGLLMMIFGGQILAYHLFRNNFVHPEDLQNF
ncbi:transmembrane protein 244 isoform X2 [Neoarius graeffei]|uniref:transmembrane protein 244 isoform X2 n=1 Tax=Neoarius graeffei TaxID=443677 RepID=UPI00298D0338|nr:transmembrane protein 244 isoform X2 [Neoarius graeffei]